MRDVLLWYLWMQAFAFGGWLIASRRFWRLPDRGYGIGKALGITLGGFAYWATVTLGFSMNHTGAALLGLAAVWGAGLWLRHAMRNSECKSEDASDMVYSTQRIPSPVIIFTEALFALAFAGWAIVRAYSPDIMSAGGEKFMESMMVNAILRSPSFPPNDAWMSGFHISYYYFCYFIFVMLIRLSGVAPAIGFNLGGAMIFALTVVSAFSIGYNLWGMKLRIENAKLKNGFSQFSIFNFQFFAGLLTAVMLVVMGNLGGLMGALKCANALPASFWEWLDVRDTATQVYACNGLAPSEFYGWWWDWSRVVKDTTPTGRYQETITEIPIFSFVLGDNHPHVMALPMALLAITLALHAFQDGAHNTRSTMRGRGVVHTASRLAHSTILPAIIFGGLAFMNTWDFPIYGAIFIGATLLGRWLRQEPLLPALAHGLGIMALGYLLYLPWHTTFTSQARGIGINLFNGTRFTHFFLIYAPFLIAGVGFIVLTAREMRVSAWSILGRAAALTTIVVLMSLLVMATIGLASPQGRAVAQELGAADTIMGMPRDQVSRRLLERITNPWTVLALSSAIAACAALILSWRPVRSTPTPSNETDAPVPPTPFILLLFGAGALLTLSVEFVFLRDLFGTRMNTVFKFYYQAWTLWSVASGFAIMCLFAVQSAMAKVSGGIALAFVALGLLYPIMAIPARTDNFRGEATLDGSAYLQRFYPDDAKMIAWLNSHVSGDPHIAEAPPRDAFGAYTYEGRIATFTGLPTVLGWGGHQHQWRGTTDEPARRFPLIEQLYNTTDPAEARSLLQAFNVTFVVVGNTERDRFAPEGLAKFDALCAPAFQSGSSVIYRCR